MPSLSDAVRYLDAFLRHDAITDYAGAHNGLQMENSGALHRIACAVDACEAVINAATAQGASLLLVHHGLYWNFQRLTGAMYRKTKAALQGDLAIYSSHLPLDLHPEIGNNVLLTKALGLGAGDPFLEYKGQTIGRVAEARLSREELAQRLQELLGSRPHLCAGGPPEITRVGIVTGGAGAEIAQAAAQGVDTFITGEGPHWSYTAAEELGVNLFYAGHYATETFGVKALAARLSEEFGVPWEFIDHPTGL